MEAPGQAQDANAHRHLRNFTAFVLSILFLQLLMHQLMQIRKLIQFFTFFILFHFILMDIN